MLRRATQQDIGPLARLRAAACGESAAQARAWLCEVVSPDDLMVVESDAAPGTLQAALALVPVEGAARHGLWLAMLLTAPEYRGQGLAASVLRAVLRAGAAQGYAFVAAAPPAERDRTFLRKTGFADAFTLRLVDKNVPQNLLAQAAFDTLTVREMLNLRQHCAPRGVLLPEHTQAGLITRLYRQGATLVSSRQGYGIYYTVGDTMSFVEVQAENDRAADTLLQAARGHTGLEHARILLGEAQPLYMGLGKRQPYGMVRFLHQPFSVTDMYFRVY